MFDRNPDTITIDTFINKIRSLKSHLDNKESVIPVQEKINEGSVKNDTLPVKEELIQKQQTQPVKKTISIEDETSLIKGVDIEWNF
jgi:hypothetical protein